LICEEFHWRLSLKIFEIEGILIVICFLFPFPGLSWYFPFFDFYFLVLLENVLLIYVSFEFVCH